MKKAHKPKSAPQSKRFYTISRAARYTRGAATQAALGREAWPRPDRPPRAVCGLSAH